METTIRPLSIKTIIDIGANTGEFCKKMRHEFPDARVHAFEPLAECFSTLQKTFGEDARVRLWNIALGETSGEVKMQRNAFHPSSSLLPMTVLHKTLYPKTKESRPEAVKTDTLDTILAGEKLEQGILIKMDVQGFEAKVIAGGRKTIASASVAIIETAFIPLYENQPLFGDIVRLMEELGFSYYGDMGRHYNPLSEKLLYEDSLFIKKSLLTP